MCSSDLITDKNGTAIPDGAAGYLACFLGFSILIFHKCNIARILVVQQILHQLCGLLFRHVLRVAVGALQKCRIGMTEQRCRHLFAGTLLQQIGGVEMPQGVQVLFLWQPALFIQLAQMPCKSIRVWHMTIGVCKNRFLSIRNAAMQHLLLSQRHQKLPRSEEHTSELQSR